MFCKYCGSEIEDNSKFCEKCGKKLDEAVPAAEAESHMKKKKSKKGDRSSLCFSGGCHCSFSEERYPF